MMRRSVDYLVDTDEFNGVILGGASKHLTHESVVQSLKKVPKLGL